MSKEKALTKIGSLTKTFGLIIYALLFLYLLERLKSQDLKTYDAMSWGVVMGLTGIILGFVFVGMSKTQIVSGREDYTVGIYVSSILLATMFILNMIFVYGKHAYSLIGDATVLSITERLFASLAASWHEEMFFRYGLQRMLQSLPFMPDNPIGWTITSSISATIFSVYHIFTYGGQGINAFVYLFLLGFVAGIGMSYTKRMSVPLLIHAENNLLAVIWGV